MSACSRCKFWTKGENRCKRKVCESNQSYCWQHRAVSARPSYALAALGAAAGLSLGYLGYRLLKDKKGKKPLYVRGPTSATVHKDATHDKHFLLFGEWHEHVAVCPPTEEKYTKNFEHYIEEQVKSRPSQLFDLFFEVDFVSKQSFRSFGWEATVSPPGVVDLRTIYKAWRRCFQILKTNCEFKNVRFHYVDVRTVANNRMSLALLEYLFFKETPAGKAIEVINRQLSKGKWVKIGVLSKIDKQIAAIRYPDVRAKLKQYFEVNVLQTLGKLDALFKPFRPPQVLKQFLREDSEERKRFLAELSAGAYKASTALMDVYALARMFRCWKKAGPEPRNIILYAGDAHAQNMREFLRSVGAPETQRIENHWTSEEKPSQGSSGVRTHTQQFKCLDLSLLDWDSIFPHSSISEAIEAKFPCPAQEAAS